MQVMMTIQYGFTQFNVMISVSTGSKLSNWQSYHFLIICLDLPLLHNRTQGLDQFLNYIFDFQIRTFSLMNEREYLQGDNSLHCIEISKYKQNQHVGPICICVIFKESDFPSSYLYYFYRSSILHLIDEMVPVLPQYLKEELTKFCK